jgi:small-conductance mechanosensitive channel
MGSGRRDHRERENEPTVYALTNPLTPTAAPDCASEEGLCRLVYRTTHVDWVAESSDWLIAKPAIILGIVVGALIVRWLAHRVITRLVRSTGETTVPIVLRPFKERAETIATAELASERRRQRAETIGSVLRSIASAAIFVIAAMTILGELGINLAPLIASAGIAGVALGFGAQSLVRDFLSGMFMILEDQYGVGDIVDFGEATGTVEGVGLRCTTVRDVNGVVWYVRNGEVIRVGNKTQGWAQVVIDVPLPYGTKLDEAQELIAKVVEEFAGGARRRADNDHRDVHARDRQDHDG